MKRVTAIGVAAAMLTLSACGDEAAEGAPTPAAPENPAGATVQSKKPKRQTPPAPFTYSPIGKRDPFRSYLADIKASEAESGRPMQETELYELDQYRLTALVTGTSQPKAMVEDPEGVGHVVQVGSRIGKNGGRVTRISAKGVLIVEEFVNPVGKRVRVPITLTLPQDEILTLEKRN